MTGNSNSSSRFGMFQLGDAGEHVSGIKIKNRQLSSLYLLHGVVIVVAY